MTPEHEAELLDLIQNHGGMWRTIVTRIGVPPEDICDTIQTGLLWAWKNRERITDSVSWYVSGCVRHAALKAIEDPTRTRVDTGIEWEDMPDSCSDDAYLSEASEKLEKLVTRLSPIWRIRYRAWVARGYTNETRSQVCRVDRIKAMLRALANGKPPSAALGRHRRVAA